MCRLPHDIENIIFDFHDEFDIARKKFEIHLILKSGFSDYVQSESKFFHIFSEDAPRPLEWYRLMFNIHRYDKRMVKIRNNQTCYSKLWDGCVPWDGWQLLVFQFPQLIGLDESYVCYGFQ